MYKQSNIVVAKVYTDTSEEPGCHSVLIVPCVWSGWVRSHGQHPIHYTVGL